MAPTTKSRRFHQSLRFKLALVSLTLLVLPLAGYRFIQDVEAFLRTTQDQNLAATARSMAMLVQHQGEHLVSSPRSAGFPLPDLYVHTLQSAPTLDGYADDWQSLLHNSASYQSDQGLAFELLIGETPSHVYLLLQVNDQELVYQPALQARAGESDQVQLSFTGTNGELRHYLIVPESPGWVVAYRYYPAAELLLPPFAGVRIQGQWQENTEGYTLELKIPGSMLGDRLALQVLDQQSAGLRQLATSAAGAAQAPGYLIRSIAPLQTLLDASVIPQHRLWLVNSHGLVAAMSGELDGAEETVRQLPWLLQRLLSLSLRQQADGISDLPADLVHLQGQPLSSALQGQAASWRRRPVESDSLILSAAYPVKQAGQIVGAVLVEQTMDAMLSIQNNALWNLLTTTFALFLLVSLVLLGYASLLTGRIRRLHKQMESAVTPDGRIVGDIQPGNHADEIGELGRGFASVLSRLAEYNRYLEAMASRLTHELRTPLTVVRTSLESHEHVTDSADKQSYLRRARHGADRLDLILRQLQEATRLEKAMQQAELADFDLCELARFNTENFATIHPQLNFIFQPCANPCQIHGAPELLSQALEKLINNAVDFHSQGTGISIQVTLDNGLARLCVSNKGPLLPTAVDLFQSMVSIRPDKSTQPHMGLGLYLVKLIAEFHQGYATAENQQDKSGVVLCISLPIDGY